MNCVGIDVSKGKSTIAVMRPFGEVVVSPFEVCHTVNELSELARQLKSLDGETRVVMESTGNYHAPVAWLLHDAGFYVSVVNPQQGAGDRPPHHVTHRNIKQWDRKKGRKQQSFHWGNITVVRTMAKMATRLRVLFALKLRFVNVRIIDFCLFMVSPPYSAIRPSSI